MSVWAQNQIVNLNPAGRSAVDRKDFADCPSAGIVLLAGMADDEAGKLIRSREGRGGFPDRTSLAEYVERVRCGEVIVVPSAPTAVSWEAAAPVFDGQRLVAALSMNVPASLGISEARGAALLRRAAVGISATLGRQARQAAYVAR